MEAKLLLKRCHYLRLLNFRKTPELPEQLINGKRFNERLILSHLAYRERLGRGSAASRIARETGLAVRTVQTTIERLGDCLTKGDDGYHLAPDAREWFQTTTTSGDHWSDRCSHLKLLLPAKGAIIQYQKSNRRFGLSCAAVYSVLLSYAKGTGQCFQSHSGISTTLNGVHRKTVCSCLNDLAHLGLITQERSGSTLHVTLHEVCEDHLKLFRPRPKREVVELREPKPPEDPNVYEFKGDGYDECRKRCRGLMVQSAAEQCIDLARQLNYSDEQFFDIVSQLVERDRKNRLSGERSVSNLGRFLKTVLTKILEEKTKALQEIEEAEKHRQWLSSKEFQEEQRREREEIAANPASPSHFVNEDSIVQRVAFCENGIKNYRAASTLIDLLSRHMQDFLYKSGLADSLSFKRLGARAARRLLGVALQDINHHYGTDSRATPDEFRKHLDAALAAPKEHDARWDIPAFEWPFDSGEETSDVESKTVEQS